ncbi:hypothetical protein DUI87_08044 [Hirundo rustica rustica]|uniref:Uncharacterized protein n=1 Tax=Hirundo rustica rustica TaxID=333673 RepID=A0A3M0KYL5_HIRRU|nr:hypothetical protein DUI87_08044 [Hirundo rustica rustica]
MLGLILFNSIIDYLNNGAKGSIGLDRVTENQLGRRGPECPGGHKVKHEEFSLGVKGINSTLSRDMKIVASRSREDVPNPSGHGPEQPALDDPTLSRG